MPTITVTTANICANPKRPQRHVVERIAQAMHGRGVVFGQEIAPSRYRQAWQATARATRRATYGSGVEVPVSVPTGAWSHVEVRVVEAHGGKRLVSPARYMTIVTGVRGGLRVALINVHTVSKGYPGRRATAKAWRAQMLATYWQRLGEEVNQLRAFRYTVIVGGDCNWPSPPLPHPAAVPLVSHGLDHLWVVPAVGTRAHVDGHRIQPPAPRLGMDHPILTATVTLTKEH